MLWLAELEQVHLAAPGAHEIGHGFGRDSPKQGGEIGQRPGALAVVAGGVDQHLEPVIGRGAKGAQDDEE